MNDTECDLGQLLTSALFCQETCPKDAMSSSRMNDSSKAFPRTWFPFLASEDRRLNFIDLEEIFVYNPSESRVSEMQKLQSFRGFDLSDNQISRCWGILFCFVLFYFILFYFVIFEVIEPMWCLWFSYEFQFYYLIILDFMIEWICCSCSLCFWSWNTFVRIGQI